MTCTTGTSLEALQGRENCDRLASVTQDKEVRSSKRVRELIHGFFGEEEFAVGLMV